MADSLRLPIPRRLTAQFVVVDPGNAAHPPLLTEVHAGDEPAGIEVRVRRIGADHEVLPAPALLAGGGARPATLSRVYEAAGGHLLVTAELPGGAGPLTSAGSERGVPAADAEPVAGHVHRACAVAARLARETGGLLLDPALARLLDVDDSRGTGDPADGADDGDGADGADGGDGGDGADGPVPDLLRIGAVGDDRRLTMTTMGLTRLGLPELRTLDLAPFLGPAWARLLHGTAWRLLRRPPGRPDPAAPSSHWLLPGEITVSEVYEGSGGRATLGLRPDPAGEAVPALIVVPPRSFTGTEDDWRMDVVNRLFPAARV